jgi:hypothetical protein
MTLIILTVLTDWIQSIVAIIAIALSIYNLVKNKEMKTQIDALQGIQRTMESSHKQTTEASMPNISAEHSGMGKLYQHSFMLNNRGGRALELKVRPVGNEFTVSPNEYKSILEQGGRFAITLTGKNEGMHLSYVNPVVHIFTMAPGKKCYRQVWKVTFDHAARVEAPIEITTEDYEKQ